MATRLILNVDVERTFPEVAFGWPEGPFDGGQALVGGHGCTWVDVLETGADDLDPVEAGFGRDLLQRLMVATSPSRLQRHSSHRRGLRQIISRSPGKSRILISATASGIGMSGASAVWGGSSLPVPSRTACPVSGAPSCSRVPLPILSLNSQTPVPLWTSSPKEWTAWLGMSGRQIGIGGRFRWNTEEK